MKKLILAAIVASISLSVSAFNMHCKAQRDEIEITLNARMEIFDGENKVGLIRRYDLLIVGEVTRVINDIEFKNHISITDTNVANDRGYNGRKYKGYLKFDLNNWDSSDFQSISNVDQIELIVNPKYKVIKTEASGNYWNPNWTWDIETREYDAVFPISLHDHHGDYIRGKCYSTATVNEVRP